ncbi:MAG: MATE family efflux transporter [Lachnospiraceae bacterium]
MEKQNTLTEGSIGKGLILFALPYLFSCFMQTFYGMADLFIVGIFNGSKTTSAVSIGSQVIHMLTVIIVGLAMGATVKIGRSVGARDEEETSKTIGTTIVLFLIFAIIVTISLLLFVNAITSIMLTPEEAVDETKIYLKICFAGIPFITAYNIISSIFRGAGDSKRPMYFVAIACIINIVLDFLFIGVFRMGAAGAALGTVFGQATSSIIAFFVIQKVELGFKISKKDIRLDKKITSDILQVGAPISLQDGLIQVAFIIITVIANSRGLIASSSVGIVEKLIGFMFLVPSAFLSAISTVTAQNMGAKKPERAKKALRYGLLITISWGCICTIYCQFFPHTLVGLFTRDVAVLLAGCEYLRSYSFDTIFAAVHFCFSGYFCGEQKSIISFIHNMIAIILVRVPGAYLASKIFPKTLYPMGWAAPLGSLLSAVICVIFYLYFRKREQKNLE